MKLFKKNEDDFSEASMTAFEELLLGKKKKSSPVVKGGSMVLYVTVIVAVLACIFMAALDMSGKSPSAPSSDKKVETTAPVDVSAYPESLQKLYKENFEAADFVVSYFDEKDKKKEVSLRGYKNGDKMPLFLQWDKQWGYLQYGEDFAGVNADGPMCLAMVGYHLTEDEKFSPDKVMSFAVENGYYQKGIGTVPKLMTEGAEKLGLATMQITPSSENIIAALQKGSPLICYMDPGKLSAKAHYVVIHAYSEGYLLINDPNSIINSEKQWLFTDIASQIKGIWSVTPVSQ